MVGASTFRVTTNGGTVTAIDDEETVISRASYADEVLEDCLEALPDAGGKISLTAGEYRLSDPIVIDRDYVTLEGAGFGFWSQFNRGNPGTGSAGPGMTKLTCTNSSDAIVVKHRDADERTDGIGGRTKGITISNLYLHGQAHDGVGIAVRDFSDQPIVEKILVQNFDVGIDADTDSGHFNQITAMDCGYAGIITRGFQGTVYDCCIADNNMENEGAGVIAHTESAIVSLNTFVRCHRGVHVTPGKRLLEYDGRAGQLATIAHNQFKENRGHEIHIDNTRDALVDGNQIQHTDPSTYADRPIPESDAIRIQRSKFVNVANNRLLTEDATNRIHGIGVDENSDGILVSGNIVTGGYRQVPIQEHDGVTKCGNLVRKDIT